MAKVLIADDNPAVLEVLARFLAASGHAVRRARNGIEARDIFDSDKIDVILTDLDMPFMHGIELLSHIRASTRPVPVIVISGAWGHGQRQRAYTLGAVRVYSKPVDFAQLIRDVEDLSR